MASASGTPVPAIAALIAGHEDTVRDVIHAFNEVGLRAPDPQRAGGRPRRINHDDEAFIVATAKGPPEQTRAAFSPAGAYANSPTTSPPKPTGRSSSAGNSYGP